MQIFKIGLVCLTVALVACGDAEERTLTQCDPVSSEEQPFVGGDGYDSTGCTQRERMANVKIGMEEEIPDEKLMRLPDEDAFVRANFGQELGGDLGQSKQALQFCPGNMGFDVQVDANGYYIPGTANGICALGDPTCMAPGLFRSMRFQILPDNSANPGGGCWNSADAYWINQRIEDAYGLWAAEPVTLGSPPNQATFYMNWPYVHDRVGSQLQDWNAYNNANVPVYCAWEGPPGLLGATRFQWQMQMRTPKINNTRYWTYNYAGIELHHDAIDAKATACGYFTWESDYEQAVRRAYTTVVAHEMGHVYGFSHVEFTPFYDRNLMVPGNQMSCNDLFNYTQAQVKPPRLLKYALSRTIEGAGFGSTSCPLAANAVGTSDDRTPNFDSSDFAY